MAEQGMRSYEMTESSHAASTSASTEAFAIATDECDGVFLSVDIDVCDPGHAPGTGTPEPGGLTARELLDAVRRICRELPVAGHGRGRGVPPYDHAEITAALANRVVLEALSGHRPPPQGRGAWNPSGTRPTRPSTTADPGRPPGPGRAATAAHTVCRMPPQPGPARPAAVRRGLPDVPQRVVGAAREDLQPVVLLSPTTVGAPAVAGPCSDVQLDQPLLGDVCQMCHSAVIRAAGERLHPTVGVALPTACCRLPPMKSHPDQPLFGEVCQMCHNAVSVPRANASIRPSRLRPTVGSLVMVPPSDVPPRPAAARGRLPLVPQRVVGAAGEASIRPSLFAGPPDRW